MTLSITKQDDMLTINLPAIFDFKYQTKFQQAYETNLDITIKKVVLNFIHTNFIDSTGLGMMLVLREYMGNNTSIDRNSISISNCQHGIKNILEVAQFDSLFSIDASLGCV